MIAVSDIKEDCMGKERYKPEDTSRGLLNGESFYEIVHASIGYKPLAPELFVPAFATWPAALCQPAPLATLAQRLNISPGPLSRADQRSKLCCR
jgi:hypothetical protein